MESIAQTVVFYGQSMFVSCAVIFLPSALQCPHLSIHSFTFILLVAVYDFPCLVYQQMAPLDGAPEEFDQTLFAVRPDRTVGQVGQLALNLVKQEQR